MSETLSITKQIESPGLCDACCHIAPLVVVSPGLQRRLVFVP